MLAKLILRIKALIGGKFLFSLLFSTALLLGICSSVWGQSDGKESIDTILNQVDSKEFMDALFGPASGPAGVEFQALNTRDVKYLLAHSGEAIPRMIDRARQSNGLRNHSSLIAYFIVFKKSKDPRVLPVLETYFNSLSEKDRRSDSSDFEEDPVVYALDAARTFVPIESKYASDPITWKREIAKQLRHKSNKYNKN